MAEPLIRSDPLTPTKGPGSKRWLGTCPPMLSTPFPKRAFRAPGLWVYTSMPEEKGPTTGSLRRSAYRFQNPPLPSTGQGEAHPPHPHRASCAYLPAWRPSPASPSQSCSESCPHHRHHTCHPPSWIPLLCHNQRAGGGVEVSGRRLPCLYLSGPLAPF